MYTRSVLSLLLAASLLANCGGGGSSPTEPPAPAPGNGLNIIFTEGEGVFGGQANEIRRHIRETWEQVTQQLSVSGMTALVNPGPRRLIPGWGIGGTALDGSAIELAVDPALEPSLVAARLPSLVAHELHHMARIRGIGYGVTLLEAMVSEGLADHYARELLGEPLPPWVTALSEEGIAAWIEQARPEFDSTSYNHSLWFFGSGHIPNWTGYSIGYKLVSDYLEDHPGESAASLVNHTAQDFRPD